MQFAAVLALVAICILGIIGLAALGQPIPSELTTATAGGMGIIYGQFTGYAAGKQSPPLPPPSTGTRIGD